MTDILTFAEWVISQKAHLRPDVTAPYDGPTPDEFDDQWASDDECDRAADVHYDRAGWSM